MIMRLLPGIVDEKKCSKCQAVKPADDFYADRRNADGRQGCCRACHNSKIYEKRELTETERLRSDLRDALADGDRLKAELRNARIRINRLLAAPPTTAPGVPTNSAAVALLARFVELHEDGGEFEDWKAAADEAEVFLSAKVAKKERA